MSYFSSSVLKFLSLTAIVCLISLSSCKKEPVRGCMDVYSENYDSLATEDDGSCFYAFEKFEDTFSVTETCTPISNLSYEILVYSPNGFGDTVLVENFGGFNNATFIGLVHNNNMDIPQQTQTVSGNTVTISGSGEMSQNTLTISYNYNVGGSTGSCTAICVK